MSSWQPTDDQSRFIKRYGAALSDGDAGIFAGAGLSRAAGFVDWRALLKDIASELRLDIDKETDLIAVAQYHLNEKRSRARLNQTIIEELSRSAAPTNAHRIIARLPVPIAWTTNYDRLLESAFEDAGKVVDVKVAEEDLAHSRRGRDVALYKMHGCVSRPHNAVVTKDDYEQYERNRPLFVEALRGDLISKTFLFLGFSFTDPNIDYILSRVRVLLGPNVREHFCLMRMPQRPPKTTATVRAQYEYERRKTMLRQADLLRFGIETVWIDAFSDIELLLSTLSTHIHRKSVLVSGAAHDPMPLESTKLDELARDLGARLMRDGYNLVSGFGIGIGEQCVLGGLRALYGLPKGENLDRLIVRPFPRSVNGDQERLNTRHREDLISRSGVVIVLSGNRARGGTIEDSSGVLEEVSIALKEGKYVIPVGATGHAARSVWEKAITSPKQYLPGVSVKTELKVLGDSGATNHQLLSAIFHILAKVEKVARV